VLVVGSGVAGATLCNELANDCEVTLLEIGPRNSIRYPSIDFQGRSLAGVPTFCFGSGGTTNLWHNGLIPINRADVRSDVFLQVLDSAQPYLDAAAEKLSFPNSAFSEAYFAAIDEASSIASGMGSFDFGVDCLLYPKRYSRLAVSSSVRAYYEVTSIDFLTKGSRLVRAGFNRQSTYHEIDVDTAVIAAGAMGSPRLVNQILKSSTAGSTGIGLAAGIGLMDHPIGFVGKVRLEPQHCVPMRRLSRLDKSEYEAWGAIRVRSKCGNYSCFAFLRPSLTMSNNLTIHKFKSLLGASRGMERLRNAMSSRIVHPDILAEIAGHLTGWHPGRRVFEILVYFEQKRGGSRVSYAGDRLQVDWSISRAELAVYNEMLSTLRDMLAPLSDDLEIEIPITSDWLWSAAHHSGTVSMGMNASDVVNTDLRLNACENVFVCDGSVIQEHSYANTGLTIGQLALRLVEHIRQSTH
jgi:choline dehydrogenase-like flavoprotein